MNRFECPLCHFPNVLSNGLVVVSVSADVDPCPVCGIRSTPELIRMLRKGQPRIKKTVRRTETAKRPFHKTNSPGVVVLSNGNYFSTYVGMGRR